MERRQFLTSAAVASVAAVGTSSNYLRVPADPDTKEREFYQLRRYQLARGPQLKLADDYFREALVPALNRAGVASVGVFNLAVGPDTPAVYVLIPGSSAEMLSGIENHLWQDAQYMKAGIDFLKAPAKEPAFHVMEVSLMQAFENMPKLKVPPGTAQNKGRLFELRTYKSPTDEFHRRKVEMFNSAEIALQAKLNMGAVFYGDTIAGSHMPNLTYMLCFDNLADREKKFLAFNDTAEWKALSSDPKYPVEIVATVTNLILSPAGYSQI
jgi:NIPSNAP